MPLDLSIISKTARYIRIAFEFIPKIAELVSTVDEAFDGASGEEKRELVQGALDGVIAGLKAAKAE